MRTFFSVFAHKRIEYRTVARKGRARTNYNYRSYSATTCSSNPPRGVV